MTDTPQHEAEHWIRRAWEVSDALVLRLVYWGSFLTAMASAWSSEWDKATFFLVFAVWANAKKAEAGLPTEYR